MIRGLCSVEIFFLCRSVYSVTHITDIKIPTGLDITFQKLSHIPHKQREQTRVSKIIIGFSLVCVDTVKAEFQGCSSSYFPSPSRLKDLLLKERSGRTELRTHVEELEGRCQSLTQQLEQARRSEEQHKTALRRLEESISHGDALRAHQQAEEVQTLA